MPPSSDGAQTEILCPSEKTEAYRPEWAQIPPRPARSRWRCKLGRNRWTIWPQLCGSQLPACNIISVMVILPWNTAEEHEQHKGGRTWLSLLLSSRSTMHGHLEPSSSATGVRCLAALVMMRRPTRLLPARDTRKRPSSDDTFRQRMQGLSVASSSSLFRELVRGRIVLPVKRTLSHLCSMSLSPTSAPPSTTFTALGSRYFGMFAARNAEVHGASSDGFTTTALPAAKAPESGSRARPACAQACRNKR